MKLNDSERYFDNFSVEHTPKEIKNFIGNKKITRIIYKIKANDSIVCGYFCIRLFDFIVKSKSLLDYANSFSPSKYAKNEKITTEYFQWLETKNYFYE